jgi:cytochrome c oxidase subunit 2
MFVSIFHPASPQATDLLWLWDLCMVVCGFILAVVTGSILYILIRYRRRDDREPVQTHGNTRLEIVWTAVPVLLVSFLFVTSIMTARAIDRPVKRNPDIVVRGHQWWWEVEYPAAGLITANEIHVPIGRDMLIAVETADVIHDFWVPELGRKMDAIPGQRNFIWIRADRAGTYQGACAEFCGAQHAWMRFRVIAQEPAAFDQWAKAQAQPAAAPSTPDALQGQARFKELTCINCHNITGVNTQKPYAPDLTHVGSRKMLAAERLENNPENMRNWLFQPNIIKPNCLMPNLKLAPGDLTALTAYLESLQ